MGADQISFECYPISIFNGQFAIKCHFAKKKKKKTETDLSVMFC